MASQDSKLISLMAGKMGVDSDSALRKASEFLRLLQLRMTASSCLRQLNDTSQIIMCLDLACNWLGHPFDKTGVVRLSGLTKKQYLNGLNLIENLLGLSKPVNVDTLCVQLGVSEVAAFAQKLLNMYVEKHAHGPKPINTNLSVYHCVAVFLACKFHKVKVEKPKLIEASRVKKIAFDKLLGDFSPFVEVLGTKEGKQTTKRSHNFIDLVSKLEDNKQDDIMQGKRTAEAEVEDFATWKKRILSEAGDDT